MISTSKRHAEHPFAGRNTQHTGLKYNTLHELQKNYGVWKKSGIGVCVCVWVFVCLCVKQPFHIKKCL